MDDTQSFKLQAGSRSSLNPNNFPNVRTPFLRFEDPTCFFFSYYCLFDRIFVSYDILEKWTTLAQILPAKQKQRENKRKCQTSGWARRARVCANFHVLSV